MAKTDQPMEHLHTTRRLAEQLADHPDRVLVDALIEGFGNLESFIRNQPDDQPMIDTGGPVDSLPITKTFVVMHENANHDIRADLAVTTVAAGFVAIKALEVMIQGLARRTLPRDGDG